jgi:hypothetical protein
LRVEHAIRARADPAHDRPLNTTRIRRRPERRTTSRAPVRGAPGASVGGMLNSRVDLESTNRARCHCVACYPTMR